MSQITSLAKWPLAIRRTRPRFWAAITIVFVATSLGYGAVRAYALIVGSLTDVRLAAIDERLDQLEKDVEAKPDIGALTDLEKSIARESKCSDPVTFVLPRDAYGPGPWQEDSPRISIKKSDRPVLIFLAPGPKELSCLYTGQRKVTIAIVRDDGHTVGTVLVGDCDFYHHIAPGVLSVIDDSKDVGSYTYRLVVTKVEHTIYIKKEDLKAYLEKMKKEGEQLDTPVTFRNVRLCAVEL